MADFGFVFGERGPHSHATLMVQGLQVIFAASSPVASLADYAKLVTEENVLGKRTATARNHTWNNLVNLYAMDPGVPVFRILRALWHQEPEGGPLMALLCALARDPLLRGSVEPVLSTPLGKTLSSGTLAATVTRQMTPTTKKAIGTRMLSSWAQAGFLDSPRKRHRVHPGATPAAATYALALGFMQGVRGSLLLTTPWTRMLDCSGDERLALVRQASRRGWLEYRAAGDVVDLRVDALFTDTERGWRDGQ